MGRCPNDTLPSAGKKGNLRRPKLALSKTFNLLHIMHRTQSVAVLKILLIQESFYLTILGRESDQGCLGGSIYVVYLAKVSVEYDMSNYTNSRKRQRVSADSN